LHSRNPARHVQPNRAIVGATAFAHESGIHQHGMLRHRGTYEILRPEAVGWAKSQMIMGRHSGRAALADRLKELGFTLDEAQLNHVFGRFKALTEKKREVFDADLEALALGIDSGAGGVAAVGGWRLHRLHVSTGVGDGILPTASVEVCAPDGERRTEAATGDGPVHAIFAALARGTGLHPDIESYQVSSVTTGEDAQGQASLTARVDGEEITGSGTSTDILEASALAWLDIVNRLHRRGVALHAAAAPPVAAIA
ncbi:MAG: alpha-isopropylmalate synthase regulatory domain-containing protein, partial [Lysobacteraceae bacterium]